MANFEQLSADDSYSNELISASQSVRNAFEDAVAMPLKTVIVQTSEAKYGYLYPAYLKSHHVVEEQPEDGKFTVGVIVPSIVLGSDANGDIVAKIVDSHAERIPDMLELGDVASAIVKGTTTFEDFRDTTSFILDQPIQEYYERRASDDAVLFTSATSSEVSFPHGSKDASPEQRAKAQLTGLLGIMARKGVDISLEQGEEGGEQLADWLHTSNPEFKASLTRNTETTLRRQLTDGESAQPAAIIRFIQVMHEQGLLRTANERDSLLGFPDLVVGHVELAELLQADLVTLSPEATKASERTFKLLAKRMITLLLAQYSGDPDRHQGNVEKIKGYIFPDQSRVGTLDRRNLISLANYVNLQTLGEDGRSYSPAQSGVIADAFFDVLSISRSHDDTVRADQELHDKLYTNLIGMMLEQRAIGSAALQSNVQTR